MSAVEAPPRRARGAFFVPAEALAAAGTLPALALWGAAAAPGRLATPAAAVATAAGGAAVAGYCALALGATMAARPLWLERLVGGLDRLYRAHRRIGLAATGLLLAHGALTLAGRGMIAPSLIPALLRPDPGWRVFSGVVAMAGLIAVMEATLYARLRHETFVRVHRLLGLVFLAGAVHAFRVPGAKAISPALTRYLAAVTAVACVALVYRSLLGRFMVPRIRYHVEEVRAHAGEVTEIVMAPLGQPISFRPGQFVFVRFLGGPAPHETHPFSISSGAGESRLRLTVKALGDYTSALRQMQPGVEALVEGPFGRFSHLAAAGKRQVWLAGGIGITPFLSMARSLTDEGYQIDLYYCTPDASARHFVDELFGIGDRDPRFRVIPVAEDRLGLISAEDVRAGSGRLEGVDFLICGPPAMIRSLKGQLRARGVPRSRIHAEEFAFR